MGNTAPLTDLETDLTRAVGHPASTCLAGHGGDVDNILRAAFVLRGIIPILEEDMEIPASIHAAAGEYDRASWDCLPTDPYGGEKFQALVCSAARFLASVSVLEGASVS